MAVVSAGVHMAAMAGETERAERMSAAMIVVASAGDMGASWGVERLDCRVPLASGERRADRDQRVAAAPSLAT